MTLLPDLLLRGVCFLLAAVAVCVVATVCYLEGDDPWGAE